MDRGKEFPKIVRLDFKVEVIGLLATYCSSSVYIAP